MRPDVVLVAVLDAAALRQVDAERGAEQRRLDVVGGQRVAGEQHVDEAGVDQRDHRRRGAGVHDAGAADPEHLLAGGLRRRACRSATWRTSTRLRLLAGDVGLHEPNEPSALVERRARRSP